MQQTHSHTYIHLHGVVWPHTKERLWHSCRWLWEKNGGKRNNMKSKTKSSFYFVSLISVADKKVTRVGVYTRHIWVHIPAYITCVYGICQVRLGRGGACLRLFIATLFRAYKYYFRPSWSGHAIARQLSGFMIWPSHTEIYTHTHIYVDLPYACLCYQ